MHRLTVGIDPSLSATGIAALAREGMAWRLVYKHTVGAPAKGSLISRLDALSRDVYEAMFAVLAGRDGPITVAAEDPSDFRIPGKGGPSQRFRFGAGVGVVLLAAQRACDCFGLRVQTYGVHEWLPKSRIGRGGWTAPTRHAHVIATTRRLIPGTQQATDDETMAAALALQHVLKVESALAKPR